MSREAFEAWATASGYESKTGQGMDYPLGRALWIAWQAARAAALEEAVDVCRKLDKEGKPDNPEYGSWGEFDDAEQAIRALKEKE